MLNYQRVVLSRQSSLNSKKAKASVAWIPIGLWPRHSPSRIPRSLGTGSQAGSTEMFDMAMNQYLLIPFLVGWTSIYQLFWCELQGYKVLTHPHMRWFHPTHKNLLREFKGLQPAVAHFFQSDHASKRWEGLVVPAFLQNENFLMWWILIIPLCNSRWMAVGNSSSVCIGVHHWVCCIPPESRGSFESWGIPHKDIQTYI